MIKKLLGLVIIIAVGFAGWFLYTLAQKSPSIIRPGENSYSIQVKNQILKYQKPARVEIVNYIKNPEHLFQKDIEDIKKLKLPLNKDSDHYIKIQFFVDETDPTAPLMGQFFIFDTKTDNLIKEDSIRFE